MRHRLGLVHRSTGSMSTLGSAVSFYRRHSGSAVQYGNDSAETTVVNESQSPNFPLDQLDTVGNAGAV